jgi:hypothetical protein
MAAKILRLGRENDTAQCTTAFMQIDAISRQVDTAISSTYSGLSEAVRAKKDHHGMLLFFYSVLL